jgi:hypothetical protein
LNCSTTRTQQQKLSPLAPLDLWGKHIPGIIKFQCVPYAPGPIVARLSVGVVLLPTICYGAKLFKNRASQITNLTCYTAIMTQ